MEFNLEDLTEKLPELIMFYGLQILLAIVVLLVGKWLASAVADSLEKGLKAKNVDSTVGRFTRNITYYVLLTIVFIAALGQLGVQTASFVAVIGAAGLAIGFALQGSLANFAAGVLLILFRPFKAGDFVEAAGTAGVVTEISIFSTILTTPDNKRIIVSNNSVMNNNIVNYSTMPTRRVDFVVGVSYSADLALVRKTLEEIAANDERILKDPGITVGVSALADSSINFNYRVWVNSADYWDVFYAINEQVKLRFDELNIEIPFPQMDVHVDK